jgi:hypothetical protein
MLQTDQRSAVLRRKTHLYFSRSLPLRRAPAEDDAVRRLVDRDRADDELIAVLEAFVEAPAVVRLDKEALGIISTEGEALVQRPPATDVIDERLERSLAAYLDLYGLKDFDCLTPRIP